MDVEALKESQKAIQSDLQEIKNLLKARPTAAAPAPVPQEVVISFDGAPVIGDQNAKVVLVDFTDKATTWRSAKRSDTRCSRKASGRGLRRVASERQTVTCALEGRGAVECRPRLSTLHQHG
jgi:hypothetical protein